MHCATPYLFTTTIGCHQFVHFQEVESLGTKNGLAIEDSSVSKGEEGCGLGGVALKRGWWGQRPDLFRTRASDGRPPSGP